MDNKKNGIQRGSLKTSMKVIAAFGLLQQVESIAVKQGHQSKLDVFNGQQQLQSLQSIAEGGSFANVAAHTGSSSIEMSGADSEASRRHHTRKKKHHHNVKRHRGDRYPGNRQQVIVREFKTPEDEDEDQAEKKTMNLIKQELEDEMQSADVNPEDYGGEPTAKRATQSLSNEQKLHTEVKRLEQSSMQENEDKAKVSADDYDDAVPGNMIAQRMLARQQRDQIKEQTEEAREEEAAARVHEQITGTAALIRHPFRDLTSESSQPMMSIPQVGSSSSQELSILKPHSMFGGVFNSIAQAESQEEGKKPPLPSQSIQPPIQTAQTASLIANAIMHQKQKQSGMTDEQIEATRQPERTFESSTSPPSPFSGRLAQAAQTARETIEDERPSRASHAEEHTTEPKMSPLEEQYLKKITKSKDDSNDQQAHSTAQKNEGKSSEIPLLAGPSPHAAPVQSNPISHAQQESGTRNGGQSGIESEEKSSEKSGEGEAGAVDAMLDVEARQRRARDKAMGVTDNEGAIKGEKSGKSEDEGQESSSSQSKAEIHKESQNDDDKDQDEGSSEKNKTDESTDKAQESEAQAEKEHDVKQAKTGEMLSSISAPQVTQNEKSSAQPSKSLKDIAVQRTLEALKQGQQGNQASLAKPAPIMPPQQMSQSDASSKEMVVKKTLEMIQQKQKDKAGLSTIKDTISQKNSEQSIEKDKAQKDKPIAAGQENATKDTSGLQNMDTDDDDIDSRVPDQERRKQIEAQIKRQSEAENEAKYTSKENENAASQQNVKKPKSSNAANADFKIVTSKLEVDESMMQKPKDVQQAVSHVQQSSQANQDVEQKLVRHQKQDAPDFSIETTTMEADNSEVSNTPGSNTQPQTRTKTVVKKSQPVQQKKSKKSNEEPPSFTIETTVATPQVMRRLLPDAGSYEDDLARELAKEKAAARARQEAEEAKLRAAQAKAGLQGQKVQNLAKKKEGDGDDDDVDDDDDKKEKKAKAKDDAQEQRDLAKQTHNVISAAIEGTFDALSPPKTQSGSQSLTQAEGKSSIKIEDHRKDHKDEAKIEGQIQSILSAVQPALQSLGQAAHATLSVVIDDGPEERSAESSEVASLGQQEKNKEEAQALGKEAKSSSTVDESAGKEVRQEENKEASKPATKDADQLMKEATSTVKAPATEEKDAKMQKTAVEKTLQLAIEQKKKSEAELAKRLEGKQKEEDLQKKMKEDIVAKQIALGKQQQDTVRSEQEKTAKAIAASLAEVQKSGKANSFSDLANSIKSLPDYDVSQKATNKDSGQDNEKKAAELAAQIVNKDPHSALKILEQPEQPAKQEKATPSILGPHDAVVAKTIELAKQRESKLEHPLSGSLFNEMPALNVQTEEAGLHHASASSDSSIGEVSNKTGSALVQANQTQQDKAVQQQSKNETQSTVMKAKEVTAATQSKLTSPNVKNNATQATSVAEKGSQPNASASANAQQSSNQTKPASEASKKKDEQVVDGKKVPAGNQLSDTKKSSDIASGVESSNQKKEASTKKGDVKEQKPESPKKDQKASESKEDSNKASIAGKVQQAAQTASQTEKKQGIPKTNLVQIGHQQQSTKLGAISQKSTAMLIKDDLKKLDAENAEALAQKKKENALVQKKKDTQNNKETSKEEHKEGTKSLENEKLKEDNWLKDSFKAVGEKLKANGGHMSNQEKLFQYHDELAVQGY